MTFGPPSPPITLVQSPVPGADNSPALSRVVMADALDTAYSRGRALVSCARDETISVGPSAAFKLVYSEASSEMVLVFNMAYLVPSPLPGSANQIAAGFGAVADTRGALRLYSRGVRCTCLLTVSSLTLPATLAGSATSTNTHGATYTWQTVDRLLPTGVTPGDLLSIRVAMRVASLDIDGLLSHFAVVEPPQTDLTP